MPILPSPAKSTALLILVCSLFAASCSILDPDSPYAGTYTATTWLSFPDRPAGPGFDQLSFGGDLTLTLSKNRTARARVSTRDEHGTVVTREPVGRWESVDHRVIVTWDDAFDIEEFFLVLPDLELQADKEQLEGKGFYPCCLGWVELVLMRN